MSGLISPICFYIHSSVMSHMAASGKLHCTLTCEIMRVGKGNNILLLL